MTPQRVRAIRHGLLIAGLVVLVTILVSIATIYVFFWVTAKIFRVGILSYGKRPTIPELWRWLKVA